MKTVKNILVTLSIITFGLVLVGCNSPKKKSGGGNQVVEVSSPSSLKDIADKIAEGDTFAGKTLQITKDMDLSGTEFPGIAVGDGTSFDGVIDGGNNTISGVVINRPTDNNVGFIGNLGENGEIKNIKIENITIKGNDSVGGLVGKSESSSLIENVTVTDSNVTGKDKVGSLTGSNAGTIDNATSTGNTVTGATNVGGITGENSGNITESTNTKNMITGTTNVGGITGNNTNEIKNVTVEESKIIGSISPDGNTGNIGGITGNNSGTIDNSTVSGGSSKGPTNVGGIAGSSTGDISNVINNSSVTATSPEGVIGGIAGNNNGGTITNSSNLGKISAEENTPATDLGGIVGKNDANGEISHTYNKGEVIGESNIGGIAGNNNSGLIKVSYSTAVVTATNGAAGGIAGRSASDMVDCYSIGQVTGSTANINAKSKSSPRAGGTAGGLIGFFEGATPKFTRAYFLQNSTVNVGINAVGNFPNTTNQGRDIHEFTLQTLQFDNPNGKIWKDQEFTGFNIINNVTNRAVFIGQNESNANKDINTEDGLISIIEEVKKGNDFKGTIVTITGNIDMSGTPNFEGIGTEDTPFAGTFDGDDHIISNVTSNNSGGGDSGFINNLAPDGKIKDIIFENLTVTGNGENVGGVVGKSEGTIDNVHLKYSNITSTGSLPNQSTGGLAGSTTGNITNSDVVGGKVEGNKVVGGVTGSVEDTGNISNVSNGATIIAKGEDSYGGGIAGSNNGGTITKAENTGNITSDTNSAGGITGNNNANGSIEQSYNKGTVSGTTNIGGIAGSNTSSSIEESYNKGDITGTGNVGGIAGGSIGGNIEGAYNTANITATEKVAGGIVGSGSVTIKDSYNIGIVTAPSNVGGVIGEYTGGSITVAISNAHYLKSSTVNSTINGAGNFPEITGWEKGTDKFTTKDLNFDNSANIWEDRIVPNINDVTIRPVFNNTGDEGGTTANQVPVGTKDDIINIANEVKNGTDFTDKVIKLTQDIDMAGVTDFKGIGTDNNKFVGTIDGSGHTIKNATVDNTGSGNVGFITQLGSNGAVKDIKFENLTVTGNGANVGGVVGKSEGTVTNVTVTDIDVKNTNTKTSDNPVTGGIVGNASGNITNVKVTGGTVTGVTKAVGGITGNLNNGVTISEASNTATVTGTGADSLGGGIVGSNNGGTIEKSSNTGNITGGNNAGGIAGSNSGNIDQSYNKGKINGATSIGGIVGNTSAGSVKATYNTGSITATGSSAGGLVGSGTITITDSYNIGKVSGSSNLGGVIGEYTGTNIGLDITTAYYLKSTLINNTINAAGNNAGLTGKDKAANKFTLADLGFVGNIWVDKTLNSVNGVTKRPVLANALEGESGSGTTDPINIGTAGEFQNFIDAVKGGDDYSDKVIKLVDNIDLGNISNFTGIGDENTPFAGTLDGNNKTIQNTTVNTTDPTTNIGFINWLDVDGKIKDLTFENLTITGNGSNVGGVVGKSDGDIINVTVNNVTVTNTKNTTDDTSTGGLVGKTIGDITSVTVTNPKITSNSTGANTATGGIVGATEGNITSSKVMGGNIGSKNGATGGVTGSNKGTISTTSNTANVKAEGTDGIGGGIVGKSDGGTITKSYNLGEITSSNKMAGGIAGNNINSKIDQSYNKGNISGATNAGGITGESSATSSIENSYNTGTINTTTSNSGGLIGSNAGAIKDSYSIGIITGNGTKGGIVGNNSNTDTTKITNVYFIKTAEINSTISGIGSGTGTGENKYEKNTTQFKLADLKFTNTGNIWADKIAENIINEVEQRPILITLGEISVSIEVGTTEALLDLIAKVEGGDEFIGRTIELTKDIDMIGVKFPGIGVSPDPSTGTVTAFKGTITGGGNKIINLTIDTTSAPSSCIGFIGTLGKGGVVKDLVFSNITVESQKSQVGGVVGCNYGTVENVKVIGTSSVKGDSGVGGIVGFSEQKAQIKNVFNEATVEATNTSAGMAGGIVGAIQREVTITSSGNAGNVKGRYAGGITGRSLTGSTISTSYNKGRIESNYTAGGIVGINTTATISKCYNSGEIISTTTDTDGSVGGIVGSNSRTNTETPEDAVVEYSYNTGNITAPNGMWAGGILGNNKGTVKNSYNIGKLANTGANNGGIVGKYDNAQSYPINNYLSNVYYLQTGTVNNGINAIHTGGTITGADKTVTDFAAGLGLIDNDIWILNTLADINGVTTRPVLGGVGEEGIVTVDLYNVDNLKKLIADAKNGATFKNRVITLKNNIDMAGVTDFEGFVQPNTPFEGTFNGGNHTISNLTLNTTSAPNLCIGFIGTLGNGGVVKDLVFSNLVVVASNKMQVGGVVGCNDGTVDNVKVTGTSSSVKGNNAVGGIVGSSKGKAQIKNVFNEATVEATASGGIAGGIVGTIRDTAATVTSSGNTGNIKASTVGGIAGRVFTGATISTSYNKGLIVGNHIAGGIAGRNNAATISKCYNSGEIKSTTDSTTSCVGGIVGSNKHEDTGTPDSTIVEYSYNTGKITADSGTPAGGVVGENKGTIKNSYNIGTFAGTGENGGIVGKYDNAQTGIITNYLSNVYYLQTSTVNNGINPIYTGGTITGANKAVTDFANGLGFNDTSIWKLKTLPNINGVTTRPVLVGAEE